MANYELIGLDETTSRLRAPTSSDNGVLQGGLLLKGSIDVLGSITPLAKAIRVALSGSASVRGPMVLDNSNLDMGTNNFTIPVQKRITTTRPSSNEILYHKHDGTTGVIVTLLTTGIVRMTINGFNYDSTVALTSASNVEPVIIIPVVRETTTAAGSVTFVVDGVQLGTAVAITSAGDTTTELVTNGGFATDITGWTLSSGSSGTVAWSSGAMRVSRTGAVTTGMQAISVVAGRSYALVGSCAFVSGTGVPYLQAKSSSAASGGTVYGVQTLTVSGGAFSTYFTAAATGTVYIHCGVSTADAVYDFDNISVKAAILSVDNASNLYLLGTSTTTTEGSYYDGAIYNRALTVAECLAYCLRGPEVADLTASQTAIYTLDASAGADGWTGSSYTVDGNIDGIDGVDNVLRSTCSSTGTGRRIAKTLSITAGARYSISISVNFPVGNVSADSFLIWNQSGAPISATSLAQTDVTKGSWQTFNFEFVATGDATGIRIYTGASASTAATTTIGDIMYISEFELKRIGATGHWPADNAQSNTGQIFDSSGNKSHMLLPASGAAVRGKPTSDVQQVRWTNSWAETNELQYIGGTNQAILPAKAYIERIVGIITTTGGSGVQDIVIGDGSDTDRYVTITTGLAAGTTEFTLANRATDGTNLKLTVDPDADCTMSIAWTITYRTLE